MHGDNLRHRRLLHREPVLSRRSRPAATPRARDAQARERPFAPNVLTIVTSAGALSRGSEAQAEGSNRSLDSHWPPEEDERHNSLIELMALDLRLHSGQRS